MRSILGRTAIAIAALTAMFAAGCDTDTQVTGQRAEAHSRATESIAFGTNVARCRHAMIGNMRIGGSDWRRQFIRAGRFGLLQNAAAFRYAQPAGGVLAPRFRDVLITKIPATVLGTGPVTLSVPLSARDEVGLLYGSLRSYQRPFARVTFVPCAGHEGTSWPGGLALRSRKPVTLFVTTAAADRVWRLTVGA